MIECIVVGAGGFIGAVCRYLMGLIPVNENLAFPIKTFAVNILGSFIIGMIAGPYAGCLAAVGWMVRVVVTAKPGGKRR